MDAGHGKLTSEAVGEVEVDDGVLVLRRIHVVYRLAAPAEQREVIERVHGFHHRFCPVFRSLEKSIDITTEIECLPADSP